MLSDKNILFFSYGTEKAICLLYKFSTLENKIAMLYHFKLSTENTTLKKNSGTFWAKESWS